MKRQKKYNSKNFEKIREDLYYLVSRFIIKHTIKLVMKTVWYW